MKSSRREDQAGPRPTFIATVRQTFGWDTLCTALSQLEAIISHKTPFHHCRVLVVLSLYLSTVSWCYLMVIPNMYLVLKCYALGECIFSLLGGQGRLQYKTYAFTNTRVFAGPE